MARASDLQVPRCVFADLCVLRTRAHCLCRQFNRLVAVPGSGLWDSNSSKTEALDILEPNACYYMPYWPAPADGRSSSSGSGSGSDAMQSHLVLAKVAGFANAVYGLDNLTLQVPALMTPPQHPGLLLAALPLSHVRRARYSPKPAWTNLWRDILRWLAPKDEANEEEGDTPAWTDSLSWSQVVGPSFTRTEALPEAAARQAVRRSLRWVHTTSGLLATRGALDASTALGVWTQGLLKGGWPSELASLGGQWNEGADNDGDGSAGIFEAFLSSIQPRGGATGGALGGPLSTQLVRTVIRTDCVGEAAGGLAVGAWHEFADAKAVRVAQNLLDYLFFDNSTGQAARPRNDPSSALGGTLLWCVPLADSMSMSMCVLLACRHIILCVCH